MHIKIIFRRLLTGFTYLPVYLFVFIVNSPTLHAEDDTEIKQLRVLLKSIEQRLTVLEQKQTHSKKSASEGLDAPSSVAATAASSSQKQSSNKVLITETAQSLNLLHVGGVTQLDSRLFLNDGGGVINNSFILRRARITTDGTLGNLASFLFIPEFGNGSSGIANAVTILDANATVNFDPRFQVKFGKFKSPVGLEELQTDPNTQFVERSLVNNLMPNRDIGFVVGGSLYSGTVAYSIGLVNGTADNTLSSGNSDFDNDKDGVARIFFQPFIHDTKSISQGLGFGVGASDGRQKGLAGVTSGYRSDGQQAFFKYASSVYADGRVWRVSPQANYYNGPLSIFTEYAISTVNVRPSAPTASFSLPKVTLQNKAWDFNLGWVLTGEAASYAGVVPRQSFDYSSGSFGAFQVVARYSELNIDPSVFPLFASPLTNPQKAKAMGIGLNWYLSKSVRFAQDFFHTSFTNLMGTSTTQILRQDENVFITRLQLSF